MHSGNRPAASFHLSWMQELTPLIQLRWIRLKADETDCYMNRDRMLRRQCPQTSSQFGSS